MATASGHLLEAIKTRCSLVGAAMTDSRHGSRVWRERGERYSQEWAGDTASEASAVSRCQKKAPLGQSKRGLIWSETRRRPTLPPRLQGSTIGAGGLNFRVRNGNGCFPSAITTLLL